MLTRFGDLLTADDHVRRADILLYGGQGPAARDMLALLPADQQAAGRRRASRCAPTPATPSTWPAPSRPPVADDPGPGLRTRRATCAARPGQLARWPWSATSRRRMPGDEAASRGLGRAQAADPRRAARPATIAHGLRAAANSGLTAGADAAEAEFYAGWIALTKLKDPTLADAHFANLQRAGTSPITQGARSTGAAARPRPRATRRGQGLLCRGRPATTPPSTASWPAEKVGRSS